MSKLTEKLRSQVSGHLKNVPIRFNADLLDQDLLNELGVYLSTKSSKKLIELSFSIASARRLDIRYSIIEQIQYKPAKQLLEIICQKPKAETGRLQQAYVPRWMVLILGSEVHPMNEQTLATVEDAINIVFRLCLELLEKSLGSDGQTTKKVG